MFSLKNNHLKIGIKSKGAELCNITSVKLGKEFLWQADKTIWGSHAPNLFPIIGVMKNDSYIYKDNIYNMPKHGFVRHNEDLKVIEYSDTKIVFQLKSNSELYSIYPFLFDFKISYQLIENKLIVNHSVKNLDKKPIYFSLGGHPAFNCPLLENENYTDYLLEFDKPETSKSHILNMNSGLLTKKIKSVFTESNKIHLKPDLFNEDALIFKDLKSRVVTLKHKQKGNVLSVTFDDFPYLGIWAKPNAPYVCIEPWIGIADSETTNQLLIEKEGVRKLPIDSVFKASYSIEIEQGHLD